MHIHINIHICVLKRHFKKIDKSMLRVFTQGNDGQKKSKKFLY